MGRKRKATAVVVSNADVAASVEVPVEAQVDDDDVSVCSNLSALSVATSNAKLKAKETRATILSLEEEAAREMRLVEELTSLKIQEVEIRRHEVEQKLEIQKRLSAVKRDTLLGHGSMFSNGSVFCDPTYDGPRVRRRLR